MSSPFFKDAGEMNDATRERFLVGSALMAPALMGGMTAVTGLGTAAVAGTLRKAVRSPAFAFSLAFVVMLVMVPFMLKQGTFSYGGVGPLLYLLVAQMFGALALRAFMLVETHAYLVRGFAMSWAIPTIYGVVLGHHVVSKNLHVASPLVVVSALFVLLVLPRILFKYRTVAAQHKLLKLYRDQIFCHSLKEKTILEAEQYDFVFYKELQKWQARSRGGWIMVAYYVMTSIGIVFVDNSAAYTIVRGAQWVIHFFL